MVLPLTFPYRPLSSWHLVSLGNAGGYDVRYDVERIARGRWSATATINGARKAPVEYPTCRAAKDYCRRDFQRRQLVRAAS